MMIRRRLWHKIHKSCGCIKLGSIPFLLFGSLRCWGGGDLEVYCWDMICAGGHEGEELLYPETLGTV
jgi:hypothetical protein